MSLAKHCKSFENQKFQPLTYKCICLTTGTIYQHQNSVKFILIDLFEERRRQNIFWIFWSQDIPRLEWDVMVSLAGGECSLWPPVQQDASEKPPRKTAGKHPDQMTKPSGPTPF